MMQSAKVMPRNYKRKTATRYSLEDLKKAIDDVKTKKLTIGKAAETYNVPKTTIFDHLKKTVVKLPRTGRKPLFTDKQETELVDYIIKCSKLYYGLTIKKIRQIAYQYAQKNKLTHNFDQVKQVAGKDWYYNFMKRHPSLSLRTPEATSLNRITAFNETEVGVFYSNLKTIQDQHHIQPDKIFNVDETGISTVQRNQKIVAVRGQKQVGKATSAERGCTTTVVCAFSAGGQYIPPFFIFKRKRMNPLLLKGSNPNMVGAVSDSGWINESLFVDWLHHFISYAKPSKEDPVLLILDNHESHISLDAYSLCREHGIIMLTLPPHTSHRLQPLDLTYFGPIKTAYNQECENHMADRFGQPITQYDIVELFTNAFNRCSNLQKAASGFRSAGIYPLRPIEFDTIEPNLSQSNALTIMNPSQTIDTITQLTNNQETEVQQVSNADTTAVTQVHSVEDFNNQGSDTVLADSFSENLHEVHLSDIIELPVIPPKVSKRNIRKRKSTILTSTPIKEQLEEKENRKKTKAEESKEKQKKIINKESQIKRLKCSDKGPLKEVKRVLKNFNNIKEFNDPSQNTKKKGNKRNEDFFCIFCEDKYIDPPVEDWIMCYVCGKWAHENCTDGQSTSA
ncbi:unnamed protein product, partial [Leptosia nina]